MRQFRDEETGAPVWQLTEGPSISHPAYFLQSSFYPHNAGLFFTSYASGAAQIHEINWPHNDTQRQLTFGEQGIHPFSPALHRDEEEICFVRAGGVFAVHRKTLAERTLTQTSGGSLGECSLSADGEWVTVAAKIDGQSGILVGRWSGADWRFHEFPRTVIHPQFHPLEPDWIEFSGDPAPRMHRMKRDGSGLECLYLHDNEEFIVHETFLGLTGDIVFTVWPHRLMRMNWHTREQSLICEYNCWHIAPNRAGTKVLCDTNHPDNGLQLIDVATGSRKAICQSKASNGGSQWKTSRYALKEDFAAARSTAQASGTLSWMEAGVDTVYGPQWTHPHPSFNHEETHVAFASDRTGITQVYVAKIPE
ncbi:MAG: oligogalacturonate lyase family protein [Bryobacter sp.]